jgi:uncharacterized protein YkwD
VEKKRTSALRHKPWPAPAAIYGSAAIAILIVFACGATLGLAANPQNVGGWRSFAPADDPLEKQSLELINRDRSAPEYISETKGRARPLEWDDRLAAVARAHSAEMARGGYFSHTAANGASPAQRISAAGIQWTAVGENIAACQTVVQAESEFMNEPRFEHNHRWNILSADYTRVGIGIVRASDGMIYITEDFAQTR